MAQYSTEAVLLSVRNWGEADKIVVFFSKNLGKIKAIAYGCRRPKSPLAGGMQVFSQLQLQVMSGGQLDTIKQSETKQAFRKVRENLVCMAYASFIVEFVTEICPERQPEPRIYDIMLAAFALLPQRNPRLVALAAAYQLLECTGYQPDYRQCAICQRPVTADAFFSAVQGGIVCADCHTTELVKLPLKMQEFIQNLLAVDWHKPVSFTTSGAILLQTEQLLLYYLQSFLEKPLKSLSFIQQLSLLPTVK